MIRHGAASLVLVMIFGFIGGCASTDWESRYLDKEQELLALQQQNDLMNQSLAEREAERERLLAEMKNAEQEVTLLSQRFESVRNQPLPEPAAQVAPPVNEELARLQAELDRLRRLNMDATLTPEGNIEITLDSDISFASGSHTLTTQGKKILDGVGRELKGQFAGNQIRVIGHTDTDPIRKSPYADNWELGAERALGVIRYLSAAQGIEPSRLVAASRGETAPRTDNRTKEGKSINRRVEVVVVIARQQIVGKN